jgi:hypothetical protein
MMARKQPVRGDRALRRRVATRRPRKTLLVFCEGERTEPDYLNALKQQRAVRDVASVDLRVQAGRSSAKPRSLVEMAAAARKRAVAEDAEIDEFWCVFDVEWPQNHAGLTDAVGYASRNGIQLAISNPCFEVWLILHFQDQQAWLENDAAYKLRAKLDGTAGKGLDAARYMPMVATAARRAARLDERHLRDGTRLPHTNPSSGMLHLLAAVQPPDSVPTFQGPADFSERVDELLAGFGAD